MDPRRHRVRPQAPQLLLRSEQEGQETGYEVRSVRQGGRRRDHRCRFSIKLDSIKTKDFRAFLNAVKADGKSLVVTPAKDEIVVKSARNIPGVETTMANLMNVYDILNAKYLVLDKEALAVIEEVFA